MAKLDWSLCLRAHSHTSGPLAIMRIGSTIYLSGSLSVSLSVALAGAYVELG